MSEIIIEAENLVKTYREGILSRKARPALEGIDIKISAGETVAFLGPNGAGKTTFLKILFGLILPTAGKVKIFNSSPDDISWRPKAGYVPELFSPPRFLTGMELLEISAQANGLEEKQFKQRLDWLMQALELKDILQIKISQYSRGMLQALALANCLLCDPELIVMDEPSANLDVVGRKRLRELLWELAQKGKTILISSHILSEVEELCERVIFIDKGKIIKEGKTKELLQPEGGYTICFKPQGPPPDELKIISEVKEDKELGIAFIETKTEYEKDRVVKILTENNISIEIIEPKQKTLEEYFLELVEQKTLEKYFLELVK